jgi:hypothetical protein
MDSTGIARRNKGIRLSTAHQIKAHMNRGARFGFADGGGFFIHSDHLIGMDDFNAEAGEIVVMQFLMYSGLIAHQHDSAVYLSRSGDSPCDIRGGVTVSSHSIDGDADHVRFSGQGGMQVAPLYRIQPVGLKD